MKKIIFVDDNADFLDLLAQTFEGSEFRVQTILDRPGVSLLEHLRSKKADAIFFDTYLATCHVKDLIQELRVFPELSAVPIYLISFSEPSQLEALAREIGVVGILAKPITVEKVKNLLQR